MTPRTEFFVVCGATNIKKDLFLFGDFLGFANAAKSWGPNEPGAYWNAFPIGSYFEVSGYTDVKFGRGQDAKTILTKFEWQHRKRDWKQIQPEDYGRLGDDAIEHVEQCSKRMMAGDTFNLIFACHGNEAGVCMGGKPGKPNILPVDRVAMTLEHFRPGVKINFLTSACRSGIWVDGLKGLPNNKRARYLHVASKTEELSWADQRSFSGRFRNTVFAGAFVRSMANWQKAEEGRMSLGTHIERVKAGMDDRGRSVAWTDWDLGNAVIDVVYTSYSGYHVQNARTARRIVTPPPLIMVSVLYPDKQPSEYAVHAAVQTIAAELDVVLPRNEGHPYEVGVDMAYHGLRRLKGRRHIDSLSDQLDALRWRLRVQEPVFLAALSLWGQGLLSRNALESPIDWEAESDDVHTITGYLDCFALLGRLDPMDQQEALRGDFPVPRTWLAVLIVRSRADPAAVMESLIRSGKLGVLDEKKWSKVDKRPVFESEAEMIATERVQPQYGFWLPHGEEITPAAPKILERYEAIRSAYNLFFENDTYDGWGDAAPFLEAMKNLMKACD